MMRDGDKGVGVAASVEEEPMKVPYWSRSTLHASSVA